MLSGGGGMVATIDDYRRFADLLLGKGELDGVRLLGRKTVEYMTRNHLPETRDVPGLQRLLPEWPPWDNGCSASPPFSGVGFGLGFSVALDPAAANVIDSPGQFARGRPGRHLLPGRPRRGAERHLLRPTHPFRRHPRQPASPTPPPPEAPHLPSPRRLPPHASSTRRAVFRQNVKTGG